MGSPGNTGCPACRLLEKPCPPNCWLAPHFPEESQDDFNSDMTTLETDNVLEMLRQHEDSSSQKRFAERVADPVTDGSPLYSAASHVLTEAKLDEDHLLDLYHHMLSINPQELSRLNNDTSPSTSSNRGEEEIYSAAIEALSKMSSPRVVSLPPARSPADAAALERIKDRFVDAMKMSIDKAIMGAEIGFFGMDLEVLQDYQDDDDDDQSEGPNDDDGDQAVESVSNQDNKKRKD